MALEALMVLHQEGSSMKKFAILSAVLFVAVFILLPGSGHGKYNVSKPLVVDGGPIPPLPPNPPATLVADGGPIPPLLPNPHVTLVADGGPIPPLPPNPHVTLVADGGPIPPLPPNPPSGLYV